VLKRNIKTEKETLNRKRNIKTEKEILEPKKKCRTKKKIIPNLVLVVGVVGVVGVQEIEFGVVDFVASDFVLELGAIASDECGGFIDDT